MQAAPQSVALSAALRNQGAIGGARDTRSTAPVGNAVGGDAGAALRLRGASYTMVVLQLADLGSPGFFERLRMKIAQAPSFYAAAPILIDLAGTSGGEVADFVALVERLRGYVLVPVGVQNGDTAQHAAAEAAGLAIFPSWRGTEPPRAEAAPEATAAARREPALLVSQPVRSGTQINAGARDLVVLAPVSAGAELLADGNIHVYAPLRGRAIAGASGDRNARIFCRSLEAELVAIAGLYRLSDRLPQALVGGPAQIRLAGDDMIVETL